MFGVEGEAFYDEYVVERPREELQIQRILPLPPDPLLLVVVAMGIAVLTVIVPGRESALDRPSMSFESRKLARCRRLLLIHNEEILD